MVEGAGFEGLVRRGRRLEAQEPGGQCDGEIFYDSTALTCNR
jgi:hypothetical protein